MVGGVLGGRGGGVVEEKRMVGGGGLGRGMYARVRVSRLGGDGIL